MRHDRTQYYLVAVANNRYHGSEPLTYSYNGELSVGAVVQVPLQRQHCLGFIVQPSPKPPFPTKAISKHIAAIPPLPTSSLELFEWLRSYYPAPLGITAQLFLPKDLPERTTGLRTTTQPIVGSTSPLPALTVEQQHALSQFETSGTHILHGETGSGKTRVYIELARHALQGGRSCIILTPEISLTSQLAKDFLQAFKDQKLHVIHSHLSQAARRNIWLEIVKAPQESRIIIGPRSALFSPLANIGLLVIDESHEFAYKQENAPHYHASRVASKLGEHHHAQVVLGSATPLVSDYYIARHKGRPIIRMSQPARKSTQGIDVAVTTVDMRQREQLSGHPHLSNALVKKVAQALAGKQQSLLFLNRRGTARLVLCAECGWHALCPHCDLPLTYHHDSHTLRCHACSYRTAALTSCPECGNSDITLKSVGTKAIETSIKKMFPAARIARFDADNLKGERFHELYEQIHQGEIDVLIGTQLLAKGLDLPKLAVVGLINADAGLAIPDFTAQEKTFQLVYQLIGRVGRGHEHNGSVVIQTYMPDNRALKIAAERQWNVFYKEELSERKQFVFPPFCYLLKLTCYRKTTATALRNAEQLAETFRAKPGILVEGPAPAFHEKLQQKYAWQLIVKSKQRNRLIDLIKELPSDWSYDIDPIDLL